MLDYVPGGLSAQMLTAFDARLAEVPRGYGGTTAGTQSTAVKSNFKLSENSVEPRDLGEMVLAVLDCSTARPCSGAASCPIRAYLNKYAESMDFGSHISMDGAESIMLSEIDQSFQALGTDHGSIDAEMLRFAGLNQYRVHKWAEP